MNSDDEMLQGYLDGLDAKSPAPSNNRTHSYRHGFMNGRDDLRKQPRASAAALRDEAIEAKRLDRGDA
jgi:hypothetical protein